MTIRIGRISPISPICLIGRTMSRIGKQSILLPDGVKATLVDGLISLTGSRGTIEQKIPAGIRVEVSDRQIVMSPTGANKNIRALWGLTRSLVANAVEGVSHGFEKQLEFEGIGFRATVEDGSLVLLVGFSHSVIVRPPDGIVFRVEKNMITVSGIRKDLVGETAARIRAIKPPEPYKGKGIRWSGEVIRRKAGKKAVASS